MKKIILAGHVTEIVGPGHHMREWLESLPEYESTVIFHPMIDSALIQTEIWKNKKLVSKLTKWPTFLGQLIFDTLVSIWVIISTAELIDVYIGLNNFDTLPALLFKKWKIKKVIYYGSDYADKRFSNPILDFIYHKVELIDLKYSSLVVSNTNRAAGRRIQIGLDPQKSIVIPNGVDLSLIPKVPKKSKYDFVFQGYISAAHGVMDAVKAMHRLVTNKIIARLAIVGYGPAESQVREYIKLHKLEKSIDLLPRITHEEILRFLTKFCLIGIASYSDEDNWTKYCSPLKVKEYLACGLAVIMSDVPEVAEDINKFKLGRVYSNQDQLFRSMTELVSDKTLLKSYLKNTGTYIKNFDWKLMFNKYLKPEL